MIVRSFLRGAVLGSAMCCATLWPAGIPQAASFVEFVDPNPAAGNQFGATVVALSTGNVVITSPLDDFGGTNAGAVYLFNGATGALISTLRGSSAGDWVGGGGVTALSNGNFVVSSWDWNHGAAGGAGAATWCSGTTGVDGVVSSANSLVGSTAGDNVGGYGVTALPNGNYVVISAAWDNGAIINAGAVTWASGTTGVSGPVSAANSLIGGKAHDFVGGGRVFVLSSGNYVVLSPNWDNGAMPQAGAVTWGSGTTGVTGVVSAANSLVGSAWNDWVGVRVTELTNGNYVIASPNWASDKGAATWGSGTTGVSGVVSAANSLVGTAFSDQVGTSVTALANGNYVVVSPSWSNGAIFDAGAATWGSGTTGVTGMISAANSLVGSTSNDRVGKSGATALSNGNYVVGSPDWNRGGIVDAGAASWGSGTTGVSGAVSDANSLVGTASSDQVGTGVTALSNGNYVVASPFWSDGAVTDAGAVTWGDGASGATGTVSAANSLVGSTANDRVGYRGVTALENGNYAVSSPFWSDGAVTEAGAVTWGSGAVSGVVSVANSLVGSTAGDQVGSEGVAALAIGNYVVSSPLWDNGASADAGAATWGSGTTGVSGVVSAANSLVGSTAGDRIGGDAAGGAVTELTNGNYLVRSPSWDNGAASEAGAVTWGSGTTGVSGTVSAGNSLVGSSANDDVGGSGVIALANGNYVVGSWGWNHGALFDAGAATWGSGTTGVSGAVSPLNSLVGTTVGTGLGPIVEDIVHDTFYASFVEELGGRVRVGPPGKTTAVERERPVAFALEGARPNPTGGNGLHVAFTLPTGAAARLEVLDVSGRRVRMREVGSLGAGRHTVRITPAVAPGHYWVRLTQGSNQRTARAVVVE